MPHGVSNGNCYATYVASASSLVIDLIGNPRSAVLTRLSGARHRLAFARFPRSLLYTMLVTHHHPVPEYTVAKRLRLLEPLGIQATDLDPTPALYPA